MLIKKMTKIYTYVFLCGNHAKYQKILHAAMIQEENDILREKFMDSIKAQKDLYNTGKLLLNNNVVERLLIYLDPAKILNAAGVEKNEVTEEV